MAQNLTTTILPSPASSKTVEFRTLTVQFGNGYRQDAPDGINDEVETWDLVYELLKESERDTIVTVLKAAKSWDIINWTAPGGTAKRYKMDKAGYTETRIGTHYNLKFKLVQVP